MNLEEVIRTSKYLFNVILKEFNEDEFNIFIALAPMSEIIRHHIMNILDEETRMEVLRKLFKLIIDKIDEK